MSTLIIGCGYLGERLGARIQARGEPVWGLVRSAPRAEAIARLGVEPVIGDVLKPETLRGLPRAERVFHAVGFDRAAGSTLAQVAVEGLRNVLNALPETVHRLVLASTTGVYGQTGGEWIDERSPAEPAAESGRVYLAAEQVARDWAGGARNLRVVVLRYAGLYGPGRVVRRALIERGQPIPGDPEKYLNLIAIDDAALAALAALDARDPEALYLVADDRPVLRGEYYSLAAALLGAPLPRFVSPEPGSIDAGRDTASKRIRNGLLTTQLGVRLCFPDITTGLPHALGIRPGGDQSAGAGST